MKVTSIASSVSVAAFLAGCFNTTTYLRYIPVVDGQAFEELVIPFKPADIRVEMFSPRIDSVTVIIVPVRENIHENLDITGVAIGFRANAAPLTAQILSAELTYGPAGRNAPVRKIFKVEDGKDRCGPLRTGNEGAASWFVQNVSTVAWSCIVIWFETPGRRVSERFELKLNSIDFGNGPVSGPHIKFKTQTETVTVTS